MFNHRPHRLLLKLILLFLLGVIFLSPVVYGQTLPDLGDTAPEQNLETCQVTTNFLAHSLDIFTQKFPFDIIGSIPTVSDECPTLVYFGSSLQFCWISDIFALFKYPIWIAVMFYIFLS